MRFKTAQRWVATTVLFLSGFAFIRAWPAFAQAELPRKVKSRVAPGYPELARRTNIRGTVKILVVVSPTGNLKDTKVMGGNPILVNAAMDALKKWKFESAQEESSGIVEFKFEPSR